MRDILPTIFTDISTAVHASYSTAYVTGERIATPSQFPCVTVVQADNYEDRYSMDNSLTEQLTVLMYEITVFSNSTGGKRSQCIDIMMLIDDVMKHKNGTRISCVEGYFDSQSKIYMVQARYRFATDGTHYYTY